ncbi:hypothetical protein [Frankia sp. CiP3]|uniref:hypothetical protein n=1 Tax=Frankia sp. CiP3 TaxID=2880971 RepID=UPI001EF5C213|nr:hypothetical protein [Frankia sp. CiP3]
MASKAATARLVAVIRHACSSSPATFSQSGSAASSTLTPTQPVVSTGQCTTRIVLGSMGFRHEADARMMH